MKSEFYHDKFKTACDYTQKVGLPSQQISIDFNKNYFNSKNEKNDFLNNINKKYLGLFSFVPLYNKCQTISEYMQSIIKKEIGCDSYLTLGGCSTTHHIYSKTYSLLKNEVEQILSKKNISTSAVKGGVANYHAWLTLDNGEIIDFTIDSTNKYSKFRWENKISISDFVSIYQHHTHKTHPLLKKFHEVEVSASVYFGDPDSFSEYRIHPVLIGNDFLYKSMPNYSEVKQTLIDEIETDFKTKPNQYEENIINNFFNVIDK